MILVVAVLIAFLAALATGGSLRALGGLRFRYLPLIFLALLTQVVIFTPIAGDTDPGTCISVKISALGNSSSNASSTFSPPRMPVSQS